jgi:phosphoglycerate dehydrogenase-like enzyme
LLEKLALAGHNTRSYRGPSPLAHALDAGQLAGAALDVLAQEPPTSSRLFGRDNVILTPHTLFYSVESLVELQIKAAQEVVRPLTGADASNPANPEALKSGREAALIDRQQI